MSSPVLSQRGLLTWAIVGDILDASKPASRVASSITNQGRILHRVSPTIDPSEASPKKQLYKKFADIPSSIHIDAVNLCVNYRIGMVVLDEMKRRGIKYCFFQPGADNDEIVQKAEELGIVYEKGCMITHPMLELDEDEKQTVAERRGGAESGCACNIM